MNWLARQALATPDAPAVRWAGRVVSYRELAGAAARAAERLTAAGVGPGERVAVRLGNRPEHVVAVHAAAWAGAVLVEIHPKSAPTEVPELLKAAKARLLVAEAADPVAHAVVRPTLACPVFGTDFLEAALHRHPGGEGTTGPDGPGASGGTPDGAGARGAGRQGGPASGDGPPPAPQRPDAVHSVLFTSGTTGRPRPVPLTCGNHLASAAASAWNLGIRPDDDWLCCLPLAHVGGLAILLRSVLQGTCVTLLDGFDPAAVAELFRSGRVTLASLVPTMLRRTLEAAGGGGGTGRDSGAAAGSAPGGGPGTGEAGGGPDAPPPFTCPRLRAVLLGGGPADPELVEAARERGLPVLTTYGMTETASQVATLPPGADRSRLASAGLPLPGTELAIRRPDGTPAPAGEPGEIAVRGPMVCQEAAGARGWLATGDLGRLDEDGFLWVEGRLDELVVTGGENVSPREVERALREHPAVAEAAVVGLPDQEWGRRVAAAVVPRDPADPPGPEALAGWCRERLAPFKVPKRWRVVDELPRTGSGKVAREQVRRLFV